MLGITSCRLAEKPNPRGQHITYTALHDVSAFEWLRPTLVRMDPVHHVAGAHTSRPLHVDVGRDLLRPDDDLVGVILQLDGL